MKAIFVYLYYNDYKKISTAIFVFFKYLNFYVFIIPIIIIFIPINNYFFIIMFLKTRLFYIIILTNIAAYTEYNMSNYV